MKNIFINGLMPERSQIFLRRLAESFHVIGNGLGSLKIDPGLRISDSFELAGVLTPEESTILARNISRETQVLAEQLATDIQALKLMPEDAGGLSDTYITNQLRPKVSWLLKMEAHFKMVHAQCPIDLVISGADYGSHARVVARTARKLGIPTLNLEHGFFFSQTRGEFYNIERTIPMFFASQYANLDSAMEVELFEELLVKFPDQGTTFLDLGTPVDTIVGQGLTREEARRKLDIPNTKKVVALVCSWIESRSVNVLVTGQKNTIDMFEDLFRTLAADEFRHELELLIKLHPAEARPDVMPGVKACLEDMARRFGLPEPRIFGDQLPEVLTAADIVTSVGFSSVLFDVFQMGKASVVLVPAHLVHNRDPQWRLMGNIPLAGGVMEVADDAADLWRRLADWLQPARQEKLAVDVANLTEKYNLKYRTVEQKSDNIIAWIKELLADFNG